MPLNVSKTITIGSSEIDVDKNYTLTLPDPPDGSIALYRGVPGNLSGKVLEIDSSGILHLTAAPEIDL